MTDLDKLKEEFLGVVENEDTEGFFRGFSNRFHHFLDRVENIHIPNEINRPTFLTKITGCSRGAARQWLQLDHTPRGRHLLFLIIFFLRYMPSSKGASPTEIETWLKYGDAIISNPFSLLDDAQYVLAKKIIVKTASKINLGINNFNLPNVITDTLTLFSEHDITAEKEVKAETTSQIILYIGRHSLKKLDSP
ncbi:MAG: hypothetical protein RPS47_17695 [Colwellia sp.]|jgi:hypothetical protein